MAESFGIRKIYFYWILFLTTLCPINLYAQADGVVINKSTGEGIPYANVWVYSKNTGASTNELGRFVISASIGDSIQVSAVGYESYRGQLEKSGDTIILKTEPVQLDEVVVKLPSRE